MNGQIHLSSTQAFTAQTLNKLSKAGLMTVFDVLLHFPRKYLDFSNTSAIKDLTPGQTVTLTVKIQKISNRFSFKTKKSHSEAVVADQTGQINVVWFNQPYVAKVLQPGDFVHLSGKVDLYKGLQVTNPSFEKVSEQQIHTGRFVPVYKLPEGIYDKTFRNGIAKLLSYAQDVKDPIPEEYLQRHTLPNLSQSIETLHFPGNKVDLQKATERLAYEETLTEQLAFGLARLERKKYSAPNIQFELTFLTELIAKLPFKLTDSQKKVLWQILQDLENKAPMNRLLMGDVGSGKTIVALLSSIMVLKEGLKAIVLVPTEVLALQHHENFIKLAKLFGLPTNLFYLHTRSNHKIGNKKTGSQNLIENLRKKKACLVVGTHALLEEKFSAQDLALVVIDEQHRFGVKQRAKLLKQMDLWDKTKFTIPHLLSMSATPIPRTLAMSLYADLDISLLTEKPSDRLPVKTWVVPETKRSGAYQFITKELDNKKQVYIVLPLIEESDKLQAKAATTEFERLKKEFPKYQIGLLHGKMQAKTKEAIYKKFKNSKIDILVSTTVIEVGTDVPNASIMVIENAERFGLAQLHQLRGRVGRSSAQSYCLLFSSSIDESAIKRLKFFSLCQDGFRLAEYDLKTRGYGTFLGSEQTGFNFKYPDFITSKVLEYARIDAVEILKRDPTLKTIPELKLRASKLKSEIHTE